jgi:predicted ATPase
VDQCRLAEELKEPTAGWLFSRSGRAVARLRRVVGCLCYRGWSEWHLGEIASCQATTAEAISLAKKLNDMNALALALFHAGFAGHFERDPAEVERCASNMIELSTRHNFAFWRAGGEVFRGWAQSISGSTAVGIARIEEGIADWWATGSMLVVPYWLALKAEVLHLADRTSEALEAITEAEALVVRTEERGWCAELHRLHGVFLTTMGADEAEIETSFREAIRIAREQKSISLEKTPKEPTQNIAGKSERVRRTWIPTTSLVTSCFVSTRF